MSHDRDLITEQVAYYRARAPEYDQWFLRQGRYDRGQAHRAQWLRELGEVEAVLSAFSPLGRTLELAAGTGLWTQTLARLASEVLAVDASPEVLELNRQRVGRSKTGTATVRYLEADLFAWHPTERYDLVFMGFWLSHVPPSRFDGFWQMVRSALAPGGEVFLVDSLHHPESTARDHRLSDQGVVERRLDDGRQFTVVKVFYQPADLEQRLAGLGFTGQIHQTKNFFIYGSVGPRERADGDSRSF